MRVMVTGGAGFVGSRISRRLVEQGDEVVVYDSMAAAEPASLRGLEDRVKVVRGDVTDLPRLMQATKLHRVEKIVHTAGFVSSGRSIDQPALAVRVNVGGAQNVLEAARLLDVGRVVYLSTHRIYAPCRYQPMDEEHPKEPSLFYGTTKLAAEMLGHNYARCYGVDFVALRPTQIYGPGRPGGERENVLKRMVWAAARDEPCDIGVGGDHPYEFVYVEDVARAVLLALDVPAFRLEHRAFNLSTGEVRTWRAVAGLVSEIVPGSPIRLGPGLVELRPGILDDLRGGLDIARIRGELGFEPRYDLRRGLTEYIDWARQPESY